MRGEDSLRHAKFGLTTKDIFGQARTSHGVTTEVIRQLDLTDPDRLEGFPIVGESEKIILFAVRRLGARWIIQLVTSASATPTVNGLLCRRWVLEPSFQTRYSPILQPLFQGRSSGRGERAPSVFLAGVRLAARRGSTASTGWPAEANASLAVDGGDDGEGGREPGEDANTSEQGLLTAGTRSTPEMAKRQILDGLPIEARRGRTLRF